jgi:hypothetical protein
MPEWSFVMSQIPRLAGLCLLAALSNTAFAGWVLFHQQGESGRREAYFADITRTTERTEVDAMLGKSSDVMARTSLWEMPVVVVHESATAPEWTELKLQFECLNKYRVLSYSEAQKAAKAARQEGRPYSSSVVVDGWNDPAKWNDPVNMRVAARSYTVPRVDLSNRPLPETDWTKDARAPMIKAQKFACQGEDVRSALQAAINNGQFDAGRFNAELQKIGLLEPVHALEAKTVLDLLNLSWNVLWKGSKRPDPSGLWVKKLSPQEKARNDARYAAIQKQMDDAVQKTNEKYLPKLKKMQAEREFVAAAAKVRGNRALSKMEASALMVWLSHEESEVSAKMGAPNITQSGNLKFLGYGQSFDNTSAMVHVPSGRVLEQGVRTSCEAQFVMLQDKEKLWRVADVRIAGASNQLGINPCQGLLTVPDVPAAEK